MLWRWCRSRRSLIWPVAGSRGRRRSAAAGGDGEALSRRRGWRSGWSSCRRSMCICGGSGRGWSGSPDNAKCLSCLFKEMRIK